MPYKERDSLHRHLREFKQSLPSCNDDTWRHYRTWVEEAFSIIGNGKDPCNVTSAEMAQIMLGMVGNQNSKAVKVRIVRQFLRFCGNKAANKWRIGLTLRPKVGGIFLTEIQTARRQEAARKIGPTEALMNALAFDMGLRCVDMCRLTMQNANEFLGSDGSNILGKGRFGGKLAFQKLNRMVREPLVRYLAHREALLKGKQFPNLFIIDGRNGPRVAKTKDVGTAFDKVSEASGIFANPHDGRRTFGHRLHLAGVPIETIATLMRQENINTAFRSYIGITQDEQSEAMETLALRSMCQ